MPRQNLGKKRSGHHAPSLGTGARTNKPGIASIKLRPERFQCHKHKNYHGMSRPPFHIRSFSAYARHIRRWPQRDGSTGYEHGSATPRTRKRIIIKPCWLHPLHSRCSWRPLSCRMSDNMQVFTYVCEILLDMAFPSKTSLQADGDWNFGTCSLHNVDGQNDALTNVMPNLRLTCCFGYWISPEVEGAAIQVG